MKHHAAVLHTADVPFTHTLHRGVMLHMYDILNIVRLIVDSRNDEIAEEALAAASARREDQGRKLLNSSHCQELCQQAGWLLIGYIRVNNQSEARSAGSSNS